MQGLRKNCKYCCSSMVSNNTIEEAKEIQSKMRSDLEKDSCLESVKVYPEEEEVHGMRYYAFL